MVRTGCLTYNHERFILDTMNGFVLQKTTFPVVYTVVDDASTDKTPEVLRQFMNAYFDLHEADVAYEKDTEYGHVTFARHKTNKNCYFAIIYLRENHFSQKKSKAIYLTEWMDTKYVALCEGDDYWTDPLKLQKQVDYMEEHEGCSCCAHNSLRLNTNTRQIGLFNKKLFRIKDYTLDTFVTKDWFTPTQSLLYRRNSYHTFEDAPAFMHGDYSLLLNVLLASGSYLHYENEIMSVYRDGGYASTHYKECDLYNDFVLLLEFYKQKSNHRCDAAFDRQIERQRLEKESYIKYQKEYKKTHSLFVRVGHWVCRAIASVVNKYVPCIHVTKKLEFEPIPNLEQLD